MTKSENIVELKKSEMRFFIFKARLVFAKVRQTFIKTLIPYYFNPEYYIWIETNIFDYTINGILNQL